MRRRGLDAIRSALAARGITLGVGNDAMAFLVRDGFSPAFGAHHRRRTIESLIARPPSEELLRGQVGTGTDRVARLERDDIVVVAA